MVQALRLSLLIPFQEFVHASSGVEELLLARKEGMAGRADFNLEHITRRGGTRLERTAAGTAYCDHMVAGMEVLFHGPFLNAVEP
jgi:hypothetical protein